MSKIRVLDEHTINKIAAGEVIENTSSVVKELVENAIDAGSTEITVEIREGGRQLIRITDNGCGMSADDAVLCLERHATSKIKQVEDIHSLYTMGFRGEAVPSIAAISKFTLLTTLAREGEKNSEGTMVIVEGGRILSVAPSIRSPGTTIEVKSLFFNIPVRKKFQKSPSYDTQEILKILMIISLGYPHIKFELISDQKQLLNVGVAKNAHTFEEKLKNRIEGALGKEFLASLTPLSFKQDPYILEGFVGLPSFHRQNRTGQYLFINQRCVQSPLVSYAVKEGYGSMLMSNRYPVFVLHLQIPGHLVDVNVHPQKKEVRIRQESRLKEAIIDAVQKTMQKNSAIKNNFSNIASTPSSSFNYQGLLADPIIPPAPSIDVSPKSAEPFIPKIPPIPPEPQIPAFYQPKTRPTPTLPATPEFEFIPHKRPPRILTTLPGYILVDSSTIDSALFLNPPSKPSEGMCIINQKAAYSRIYYERLLSQNKKTSIKVQPLLIPVTLEFPAYETLLLKEYLPLLQQMGFGIQEFGERIFSIDAIPDPIRKDELESCLLNIMQDLREFQDSKRLQKEKEKRLATVASQRVSSLAKRISLEEAQLLINELLQCQTSSQCPLGMPTVIHLSSDDLEKLFQK